MKVEWLDAPLMRNVRRIKHVATAFVRTLVTVDLMLIAVSSNTNLCALAAKVLRVTQAWFVTRPAVLSMKNAQEPTLVSTVTVNLFAILSLALAEQYVKESYTNLYVNAHLECAVIPQPDV